MDGTQQIRANRRDVMKAAGGAAATAALGAGMTGSASAGHSETETGIRVNQVGYPMDAPKRAFLTSQAMDVEGVSSFQVVDVESGDVAMEGELNSEPNSDLDSIIDGPLQDEHGTNQTLKWANFSDLSEAGEYKVVAGDQESRPFRVDGASAVYKELLRDVGRLYTLKRSATEIDDPHTGLDIGPGHTQDAEAVVTEPVDSDFLAEEEVSPGDTIDVSWGWYDAGDYGKYTLPGAITVAQMMLAYERNPDAFHAGQFYSEDALVNPEDDFGSMPDVLVEAKQELKFLQAMQRSSGALWFKLAGSGWPQMTTAPGDDDMTRYVWGNSSAGTAYACGAFAMAARVYQDHDSEFADEMLSCAEDAFSWLESNPDLVWDETQVTVGGETFGQDSGSGRYGRGPSDNYSFDEDGRYWAAAELLRTTGDSSYDDYITSTDLSYTFAGSENVLPGDVESPIDWNNVAGLGNYAYYQAGGEQAVVTDSSGAFDDTAGAAGGLTSAIWIGQKYVGQQEDQPADFWTSGVYDYYWGHLKSGVSRGNQGKWSIETYLDQHDPSSGAYFEWIQNEYVAELWMGPLHHALGRSATGYSYVTGHGERSTMNPHDRIIQSQEMEHPIPGMLVGGPHNNVFADSLEGDETSSHVSQGVSHLMSYYDAHGSYATNEWAVNYTAPLFLMLADVVGEISSTPEPDYENLGGPVEEEPPATPSGLSTSTATDSVTLSWDEVGDASSYEVYLDGSMEDSVSGSTSYTFSGLSAETEYSVGVVAVNADGKSEMATATAMTGSAPTEGVEVGDETVCQLDGDDLYKDIDCDGELRHADVQAFFRHQHRSAWKQPDMFDYSGNGAVNHGDVVALFEEIASQPM